MWLMLIFDSGSCVDVKTRHAYVTQNIKVSEDVITKKIIIIDVCLTKNPLRENKSKEILNIITKEWKIK